MLRFFIAIHLISSLAYASAQTDRLEAKAKSYLNSILNPEDYLLYIVEKEDQKKPVDGDSPSNSVDMLPGMNGATGRDSGQFIDTVGMTHEIETGGTGILSVNLMLDKHINRQKVKAIREALSKIIHIDEKRGDELKTVQANIRKEQTPFESAPAAPPIKEKTWIDSVAQNQWAMLQILAALLGGVVIVTIVAGLTRYFLPSHPKQQTENTNEYPAASVDTTESNSRTEGSDKSKGTNSLKRDELYSKDSEIFKMIKEILTEAKSHPKKIAQIMSNWIQQGEDGIGRAALLFQNFEIKTAEEVSKELTGSDMDLLATKVLVNFDLFSDENIRVIFLARQEITRLASYATKVKHAEPLKFLNLIADDLLAELLRDESMDDLALILTQVPAHRVTSFINNIDEVDLESILKKLVTIGYAHEDKFESIKTRLQTKIEEYTHFALTPKTKELAIANIVKQFTSTDSQRRILEKLAEMDKNLEANVKDNILLYDDLVHFPDRFFKILVAEIDPQVLAKAYSKESSAHIDRLAQFLPRTSKEIFDLEVRNQENLSSEEFELSKMTVLGMAQELLNTGIINFEDIKQARKTRRHLKITSEAA